MPITWQINYLNLLSAVVAIAGVFQFLGTVYWAIESYPEPYHWETNFISDLGRLKTANGFDNSPTSNIFRISTAILGLSLVPFMLAMPEIFSKGRHLLRLLGLLSALGLFGIGQTPYDVYFGLHHIALAFWIVPMALMVVAIPVLLKLDGAAPDALIALSIALVGATVLYGCAGFHTGYVLMQKLVVLMSLLWLLVVTITVSIAAKYCKSDRQRLLAKQADWYGKNLRRRSGT